MSCSSRFPCLEATSGERRPPIRCSWTCGRLHVEKGLELLLRAFSRARLDLPTARLRIVGWGPLRPALERLSTALGIQGAVTFRGHVAPHEVERELTDAWALVAPSLWAEPFGLVAVEAIVRGVPVLASANGGFGESIVPGVSGLLFPNGDEAALAAALRAIGKGAAFPSHAIPEATVRQARERYSLDRHVEELRNIFSELTRKVSTPTEPGAAAGRA